MRVGRCVFVGIDRSLCVGRVDAGRLINCCRSLSVSMGWSLWDGCYGKIATYVDWMLCAGRRDLIAVSAGYCRSVAIGCLL